MSYKPPSTKDDLRKKLQQEIRSYLQQGGKVDRVPTGHSGREDNRPLKTVLFDTPKAPRTYVNDLVATIEERRRPVKKPAPPKSRKAGGRYKTIYDDFGEPLRRVWVDE